MADQTPNVQIYVYGDDTLLVGSSEAELVKFLVLFMQMLYSITFSRSTIVW